MRATQQRLLPDARPLPDLLGAAFFRTIPTASGVYRLRDSHGVVLYVGKARNLRQRLASYRVANPETLPRRRLRLLHQARSVDWEITSDEAAALVRERELLQTLRPRFNRAGVWVGPAKRIAWRAEGPRLHLTLVTDPEPGWIASNPLGMAAPWRRAALVRLLWIAWVDPGCVERLPAGWAEGRLPDPLCLEPRSPLATGMDASAVAALLESLLGGDPGPWTTWMQAALPESACPFVRALAAADLETMAPQPPAPGS